jgi:hypothetical protein
MTRLRPRMSAYGFLCTATYALPYKVAGPRAGPVSCLVDVEAVALI